MKTDKVVELVDGGYIINEADPLSAQKDLFAETNFTAGIDLGLHKTITYFPNLSAYCQESGVQKK